MNLRQRLILLILGTLVLTLGLTWFSYGRSHRVLHSNLNQMGTHTALQVAKVVDEYVDRLQSTVINVSQMVRLAHTQNPNAKDDDLTPLFQQAFSVNKGKGIVDVFMGLEKDGSFVDGTGWLEPEGYDCRRRPWYRETIRGRGPILTTPYLDMITGRPVVSVTLPLYGETGTLLGVVGVDVDLKPLGDMVARQQLLGEGYGILTDTAGSLLAYPDPKALLEENISVPSNRLSPSLTAIGRDMVARKTGFGDFFAPGSRDPMRAFYAPTRSGLLIAIVFPRKALDTYLRSLALESVWGTLGTLALVLALLVPVVWGIRRPLISLLQTSESIQHQLSQTATFEDVAFSLQRLTKDIQNQTEKVRVPEIQKLLGSLGQTLQVISQQQEEITAYIEETTAMNNTLEDMNLALQQRERIWSRTLDVSRAVTGTMDFYEELRHIADTVHQVAEAFGVSICTLEEERLVPRTFVGYENRTYLGTIPLQNSVAGRALERKQPIWVPRVDQEAEYLVIHPKVVSEVEIPLLHYGETVGVLEIGFDQERQLDTKLLETLIPVASALAGFIHASRSQKEIRNSYRYLADKLQNITGIYHDETAEHLERVGAYCRLMAQWLGRNPQEREDIALFSRLHDIGKIRIPLSILTKPSTLTSEEMEVMQQHTTWGAELLGDARWLRMARNICLCHHEKWDGSGYPRGLRGEEIPWEGQVVALADIYDALRAKRVYKGPMPHAEVARVILEGDGRTMPNHFSPTIQAFFAEQHLHMGAIFDQALLLAPSPTTPPESSARKPVHPPAVSPLSPE